MKKTITNLIHVILCACCLYLPILTKAALVSDLKDGQHILLMRHADAPGYGDPKGYVIGQCSTQRNLGDYGKNQAKAIGSFFDDMSLEQKQTKQLEQFVKNELHNQAKVSIILVTHHVNIQAYTGKVVDVGDMVLVKVNKNGEYLSHIIYSSPKP